MRLIYFSITQFESNSRVIKKKNKKKKIGEGWNHGSQTSATLARRIGNVNSIGKLTSFLGGSEAVSPLAFGGTITLDFPSDAPVHFSSLSSVSFSNLETNYRKLYAPYEKAAFYAGQERSRLWD